MAMGGGGVEGLGGKCQDSGAVEEEEEEEEEGIEDGKKEQERQKEFSC